MTDSQANQSPIERIAAAEALARHHSQDVICVDGVSFDYDGKGALDDITLHVQRGTTLGVIGPNGSGKTTLLRLMLGLLQPSAGTVTVLGLRPQEACARGDLVGYVPQRHQLDWTFPVSVRQVVELGLAGRAGLVGRLGRAAGTRALELLEAVGMRDLADEPIGELSGGQQQRVFVARSLVTAPQVVLMDEPMSGVDQGAQQSLMTLMEDLKSRMALTLVMVSHSLRDIIASCDQVACLNRTLHYHDRPAAISKEMLLKVFQCDFDALLGGHEGHVHEHEHEHEHVHGHP
jgi:zinc transport system ATP-binding protein